MFTAQYSIQTLRTDTIAFSNSAFCPHSIFMGIIMLLRISTDTILNGVKQFIFLTETCCVIFEVGNKFINIIYISFGFQNVRW